MAFIFNQSIHIKDTCYPVRISKSRQRKIFRGFAKKGYYSPSFAWAVWYLAEVPIGEDCGCNQGPSI